MRNLICDLGGVLYALDYSLTQGALSQLAREPVPFGLVGAAEIFNQYDRGQDSTAQFRQALRQQYRLVGSDQAIDNAWNALLLYLIPERLGQIQQLKSHYRLALLSNINELHYAAVLPHCGELFGEFERCFFSYQLGLRKPEPEIFSLVLREMDFCPADTLFIDDSPEHIASAQRLGLQTYHVHGAQTFERLWLTLIG